MKRLSLKRDRSKHDTSEIAEISEDDESFDALPSANAYTGNNECTAETSNVPNSLIYACSSNPVHDSRSDDDVIIEEMPSTSKGNYRMFHWNKNLTSQMPQYQNISKGDNSLESEAIDMKSGNDDPNNLITLDDTEEEASPPQVTVHHIEMIAGVKVKFPLKPYPCQKAVMHKVSIIIM